jgi:hypothetical protein
MFPRARCSAVHRRPGAHAFRRVDPAQLVQPAASSAGRDSSGNCVHQGRIEARPVGDRSPRPAAGDPGQSRVERGVQQCLGMNGGRRRPWLRFNPEVGYRLVNAVQVNDGLIGPPEESGDTHTQPPRTVTLPSGDRETSDRGRTKAAPRRFCGSTCLKRDSRVALFPARPRNSLALNKQKPSDSASRLSLKTRKRGP